MHAMHVCICTVCSVLCALRCVVQCIRLFYWMNRAIQCALVDASMRLNNNKNQLDLIDLVRIRKHCSKRPDSNSVTISIYLYTHKYTPFLHTNTCASLWCSIKFYCIHLRWKFAIKAAIKIYGSQFVISYQKMEHRCNRFADYHYDEKLCKVATHLHFNRQVNKHENDIDAKDIHLHRNCAQASGSSCCCCWFFSLFFYFVVERKRWNSI